MDSSGITQLLFAMTVIVGALVGFNALVGKGPRGTISICAICLFTWAAMLSIVLRNPDDLMLSQQHSLLIVVLRLAGAVGFVFGIFDLLQSREEEREFGIGEWLVRQPILWGVVISVNFYALLYVGTIDSPLVWRYTAGHPVEVVEAVFFFIGMAILCIRFLNLRAQKRLMAGVTLGLVPAGGESCTACGSLLVQLAELPKRVQQTYLVRRLREALQFVGRKGSADDLDDHLRYLEELDALQAHSAYATLRIIIWAIPILGFLGTVIGITVAIANLSPDALEQSLSDVTQGLGVAFDTTAEALALTMILMFTKAWVERVEEGVLSSVDAQVARELVGRFETSTIDDDPNVAKIRRMSEHVIEAVEALAARQAEVWKSAINETHQQWADVSIAAGHIVKESLTTAIKDNLEQHARVLGQNALRHADRLEASSSQHVERLDRSAQETTSRLREGLEKVAELLVEALERHGEVLTTSETELAEQNREHLSEVEAALGRSMVEAAERQEQLVRQSENLLKEMQVSLVEAAGATVRQQEQLVRQGDVLLKVVDATGQIRKLEEALSENLAAVRQAHSFEDMAVNLAAAIQLLSARLGHVPKNQAA